jgi:hypothetical protein
MLSLLPQAIIDLQQQGLVRLVEAAVQNLPHLVTIDASVAVRRDEDTLYASHPTLHRILPRGLCFVVDIEQRVVVCTLAGLRKFTYDEGLTDAQRKEELTTWFFISKLNGECLHVAAFHDRIAGLCMVSGSKNVHGVFRVTTREQFDVDVQAYTPERRYSFAVAMVRHLADTKWEALVSRVLPDLLNTRQTLCLESCRTDSLHLVHYETSQAFAFALTDYQCMWTCCDPTTLVQMCQAWGMDVVPDVHEIDASNADKVAAMRKYFYELQNSEGAVVYALDAQRHVIAVHKYKNFEYSLWRSVRERLRGRGCSAQGLVARISYPPYHVLHPQGLAAHTALVRRAVEFRAFYIVTTKKSTDDDASATTTEEDRENDWDASSQWVALRHTFDQLTADERANFCARNAELEAEQERKEYAAEEAAAALAVKGEQVQILCIGPPGSFKSSIGRAFVNLVRQTGHTATYIDQDMLGGSAGAYHEAAKKATAMAEPVVPEQGADASAAAAAAAAAATTANKQGKKKQKVVKPRPPPVDVVVFAKSHGSVQIRDNLRKAIQRQRLVYVVMHHSDDQIGMAVDAPIVWGTHMRDACIRHITARGSNHLTLPSDHAEMPKIVADHVASFQPLEPRELRLAYSDGPAFVLLDVKAPITLVEHVSQLAHAIGHLLPNSFAEYVSKNRDEALAQAAQASLADEARLEPNAKTIAAKHDNNKKQYVHRPGHYWCIQLDEASVAQLVTAAGRDSSTCNLKMHVTLYFPGQDPKQTPDVYRARATTLDALIGSAVEFTADKLVCDSQAVAAKVVLPNNVPFVGLCPHVTMWTAANVKAVYCGQLVADSNSKSASSAFASATIIKSISMPLHDIRLSGTIVRG